MKELMDRIRKLEGWQQRQIIASLLWQLDFNQRGGDKKSIEEMASVLLEIEEYEKINGR